MTLTTTFEKFVHPVKLERVPENFGIDIPMEQVKINCRKLKLDGQYLKLNGSRFVVLFAHSGWGNLYDHGPLYAGFKDLGLSVLAFDYQGFGLSDDGELTEENLTENAMYAFHWLKTMKWEPSRIILYGQGFGATILADVGKQRNGAGWIAENAISSISDLVEGRFRKIVLEGQFDLNRFIDETPSPHYFLQGSGVSGFPLDPIREMVKRDSSGSRLLMFESEDERSLIESHPVKWREAVEGFLGELESREPHLGEN